MTPSTGRLGILFVLSAPSGAGKSTLRTGLQQTQDFAYSVSCTTRLPRQGEVHGVDYFFITHADFEQKIAAGEFLEYAQVHGNYYGTLKSVILESLRAGIDVLIDIDVQGAAMIRADEHPEIRDALADVFLMPPSMEILRKRLAGRGTETAEQMAIRLNNATAEMRYWPLYHYTLISGLPEEDLAGFRAIMQAERCVSKRLRLSID